MVLDGGRNDMARGCVRILPNSQIRTFGAAAGK